MTTVNPELDSLDPQAEDGPITLISGSKVDINRLRTREMLSLLRILTRGAGGALADLSFDGEVNDFAARLIGIAFIAIPEAEDETITFVNRMVSPAGLIVGRKLSKAEQEINSDLYETVGAEMENPELEDMFSIVERVVQVEAPHMQALGKKFAFLLQTATGTTTAPTTPTAKNASKNSSKSN